MFTDICFRTKNDVLAETNARSLGSELRFLTEKKPQNSEIHIAKNHLVRQYGSFTTGHEKKHLFSKDILYFSPPLIKLPQSFFKFITERKKIYVIGFSKLFGTRGIEQELRIFKNHIKLLNKFKCRTCICSLAIEPWGLRAEHELIAFARELGLSTREAAIGIKRMSHRTSP